MRIAPSIRGAAQKIVNGLLSSLNKCVSLFNSKIEFPEIRNLAEFATMDIDEIVLVGGSTRVPRVKEWLKEYFNKDEIL